MAKVRHRSDGACALFHHSSFAGSIFPDGKCCSSAGFQLFLTSRPFLEINVQKFLSHCPHQPHITHSRGSIELKVMALIWEQLLQCMDPLCLWEAEDMERGFGVQLSWSLPGITHLSTPGSILEASERTRQNTALRPLPEMGSALCSPERHLRTNQRLSRLVNSDPGCRVRKSEVIYEVKNSINSTQTKTPPLSAIRV